MFKSHRIRYQVVKVKNNIRVFEMDVLRQENTKLKRKVEAKGTNGKEKEKETLYNTNLV